MASTEMPVLHRDPDHTGAWTTDDGFTVRSRTTRFGTEYRVTAPNGNIANCETLRDIRESILAFRRSGGTTWHLHLA